MEADGTTRVFHLRNDWEDQYVRTIYPKMGEKETDQSAIVAVERRIDIDCMSIYYFESDLKTWKILDLAPWLKAKNIDGLSKGIEVPIPRGTHPDDEYRVMASVFDNLLRPRGLARLKSGNNIGLTIMIG